MGCGAWKDMQADAAPLKYYLLSILLLILYICQLSGKDSLVSMLSGKSKKGASMD